MAPGAACTVSLRRRLLTAVVATLVLVGIASAVFVYMRAAHEARELLDDQLRQVAALTGASVVAPHQAVAAPTGPASDPDDALSVTIWDTTGRRLYSTRPALEPAYETRSGWSDESIAGIAYRVYRLASADRVVAVAQSREVRDEAALGSAAAAALPVVLAVPLLVLVVAFVIRRALAPLDAATRDVAGRPSDQLTPLALSEVPDELHPFVAEIDRLLERVRGMLERERSFLADAAHALRTPITALSLQVEVLAGARTDAARTQRLAELQQGVARVRRLVDQLLVQARQDGRAPSDDGCELGAAVRNVLELYADAAAQRSVALTLEVEGDVRCCGTPADLVLAVGNLVDNAVRSSPPGGRVHVTARADARDGGLVEVQDEGPGIPEAELARVFDRFYQGPHSAGSAGLGLATVRRLVEQHGGSVTLSNRDERGLVACIRLPRSE